VRLVAYKLRGPWRKRRSDFGRVSIRRKCQLFFVNVFRSQYWLALAMIVDEINDDLNWLILIRIQIDYIISRTDYNMYRIDLRNRRLYNEARVESLSKKRLDRARIYDLLLWLAQLYLHRFRCWEQMTVSIMMHIGLLLGFVTYILNIIHPFCPGQDKMSPSTPSPSPLALRQPNHSNVTMDPFIFTPPSHSTSTTQSTPISPGPPNFIGNQQADPDLFPPYPFSQSDHSYLDQTPSSSHSKVRVSKTDPILRLGAKLNLSPQARTPVSQQNSHNSGTSLAKKRRSALHLFSPELHTHGFEEKMLDLISQVLSENQAIRKEIASLREDIQKITNCDV
jgi:hypothetical protein